jgi:LAS superfamily LD-carboxypeptidase LdcB
MTDTLKFSVEQLTGRTRSHLREIIDPTCTLHREVVSPFLTLRAAAAADGIGLAAFSSFRDFDRQLAIWNGKFRGERPMQDRAGRPLDVTLLTPAQRVEAILWWSALPGTSRHHWGTDFDVMDTSATPAGYKLQVIPAEYLEGGPFHRLTRWLDENMHAFGFYRPYSTDRGGVSPEPWHLSYAPVAHIAATQLTVRDLSVVMEGAAIEGKDEVLASLDRNYAAYVLNVDAAPLAALKSPRLA